MKKKRKRPCHEKINRYLIFFFNIEDNVDFKFGGRDLFFLLFVKKKNCYTFGLKKKKKQINKFGGAVVKKIQKE